MLLYSAPHGLGLVLDKVTRQGGPHTAGWEDQFEVGYIVLAEGFDHADAFESAVRKRVNDLHFSKCVPPLDNLLLLCIELDLRPVSLGKQGRDEQASSDQQEENEANDIPRRPDEQIGRHILFVPVSTAFPAASRGLSGLRIQPGKRRQDGGKHVRFSRLVEQRRRS